jgi:hypothetical protein
MSGLPIVPRSRFEAVIFSAAGCDKRAKLHSRCADAEILEPCEPELTPMTARAGTPDWYFAPLVTPYEKLTAYSG